MRKNKLANKKAAAAVPGTVTIPHVAVAGAAVAPSGIADVTVDVTNGEFLHYKVEVEGGNPNFTFACRKRHSIKKAADFPGHPRPVYEWDYLNKPGEVDEAPLDAFTLVMIFIAARQYHVVVEHRKADGSVGRVVSDRTFQSDDPEDVQMTALVVEIR